MIKFYFSTRDMFIIVFIVPSPQVSPPGSQTIWNIYTQPAKDLTFLHY